MKQIVVVFLILVSYSIQAQGFGRNTGRRGNSIPQAPTGQSAPERPDASLISIERSDMYAELLGIDVFTKEVLKSYLKDYYATAINISYDQEMPLKDKQEKIELEKKKLEKSLGDIFNEEQVERIMREEETGAEGKKYKKEKRKKKRKKNKDSDN